VAAVLFLVLGTYALSCALPVLTFALFGPPQVIRGWQVAWAGFVAIVRLGLFDRSGQPGETFQILAGWLPNPLLWAGAVAFLCRRFRAAALAGSGAFLLGLIWLWDLDEHGFQFDLKRFEVGYWCWLASMAALAFVAAAFQLIAGQDPARPAPGPAHALRSRTARQVR
jgi:hypothetical protein